MLNPISYRRLFTLPNGKKVKCRLMNGGDTDQLIILYHQAPPEDTYFLKQVVNNANLTKNWLKALGPCQIMLVAQDIDQDHLIATAQLERGLGCSQHIGDIQQIFVARPFQNLGLGSLLLGELIDLARGEKLQWLKAEVVAENKKAVKGFLAKGFMMKATLEDFFVGRDGRTYDVVLLTRPVFKEPQDDF
jgi:GNAT superfamily N-acetyltransferase